MEIGFLQGIFIYNPFIWVIYFFAVCIAYGYADEFKKKRKK
tara:strand:+ start:406 stop:528 length:123 start_codon:yes stop_codon:yes gene_type:complete